MPQYQTYGDDTITASDKVLFYKNSSSALKTTLFSALCTAVRTAIASFFTSSTIMPSTAPAAGRIPIGNGTAYAPTDVTGDVTISSSGVTTIANQAVGYAKLQSATGASKLLGRGSTGAGAIQELSLGTGLSISGTVLNVSAGTGNVTQASNATAANRLFVSGGTDKSRVETPVEIDAVTGDLSGIGELGVEEVVAQEIGISATHATDATVHGVVIKDVDAGATIAAFEVVMLDGSGTWQKADANDAGLMPGRGLSVEAGTAGNPMKVLVQGTVRNDGWNWTPGGSIFISETAGALTQTPPATDQLVGFAITADIAFFNFGAPA